MLIIFIIPFAILLIFIMARISENENQSANQYLSSNIKTVSNTVDQILKNLEYSYVPLLTDNEFTMSVKKLSPYDKRDPTVDYLQLKNIKNGLAKATFINDYVNSAYVYCLPSNRIFASNINWDPDFDNYNTKNSDWFNTYKKNNNQQPFVITTALQGNRKILVEYKEMREYGSPNPIAVLSINMDNSVISNLLQEVNVNKSGYSFLVDPYSSIISNSTDNNNSICGEIAKIASEHKSETFFSTTIGGKKLFVSTYTSSYSHLTYFVAAPLKDIKTVTPLMKVVIILFFLDALIVLSCAILLAYHYFFRPIQALFDGMKKVENGLLDFRMPKSKSYEIGYINYNFNNMVQNIDKLIKEDYINKLVNKESQLKTIQNQLNEHFLYNTLDSIHWMARTENAPVSCDMIFSLATFYRLSLSSGKEFISILEVVEIINNYMHIQKIRMEEAFVYNVTLDETISDVSTSKFLFQPIVENAIHHGLRNLDKQGIIAISFTKSGEAIRFCVQDNGNGMDSAKLEKVLASINSESQKTDNVFALKTIQSQLKIYYGENCNLHIESNPDQGTKVWFDFSISYEGRLLNDQNDNR